MKLKGRVAVVTGASGGMGRDLVCQLAEAGADVSCCDVSEEALQETLRLARERNGAVTVTGHIVDVTDQDRMHWFASQVVKDHGAVHLLFANAGVVMPGALIYEDSMTADDIAAAERSWDRCFDVDYFGVLYSVRAFLPHIQRTDEGYLVLTSSLNGLVTWPEHGCYTAAKFAVRGLAHSLMAETAARAPHVHVASVHPGGVTTQLVSNSLGGGDHAAEVSSLQDKFSEITLTTSADAATIILDGVRGNSQRILVGPDAKLIDVMERLMPLKTNDFFRAVGREGVTRWSTTNLGETEDAMKKISLLGWGRVLWGGGGYFLFGVSAPFAWRAVSNHRYALAGAAGAAMLIRSNL